MKTKILTILFLAFASFASAQKEPMSYEWFEKQSEIISDLQIKVTGLKAQGFDVTFPKDNFKVFYHDKLASWSSNFGTSLLLVEDIDFSKVIGIAAGDNLVIVIFPENLTIQVYGEQNSTTKHNTLDFYTNSVEDRQKMFMRLYELISFMKVEKGVMKDNGDWEMYWQEYQKLKPYEFYKKYPKSILAYEGKLLEEDYERQIKFANTFINRYNLPSSSSGYAFSLKDKIKKEKQFISEIYLYNKKLYDNKINTVYYTEIITKDNNEARQKYNEIVSELSNNFDEGFISKVNSSDDDNYEATYVLYNSRKGAIDKYIPLEKTQDIKNIRVYLYDRIHKNEKWYEVIVSFEY